MNIGALRTATVAVATSALLLAPATSATANAAPTGCKASGGGTYATAHCTGGSGRYWAWANCQMANWPYWKTTVHGSSKKARSGQTAWVWCPPPYLVIQRGVGVAN